MGISSIAYLHLVDQGLQLPHTGPVLAVAPEGLQSHIHSQGVLRVRACAEPSRGTEDHHNLQEYFNFIWVNFGILKNLHYFSQWPE